MSMYERTQLLLGEEGIKKLKNAKVIVFGVGGVGGYVCEMLVRTGVGHITIVDCDRVDSSNINRQIIATTKSLGKVKVEVMKQRLLDINPEVKVTALFKRFNENTKDEFDFTKYDYVIDSIDSLFEKLLLIKTAKNANANIVSSMGTGNRKGIPSFEVCDIFETIYDGLARKIRKELKEAGVKNLPVVYTKEPTIKQKPVASVGFYPAVCGATLASFVVNELIK